MKVGVNVDISENQGEEKVDIKLDEKLLTVKEVANLLEETPNVIRNWLKDLKMYIPTTKNESGYNVFGSEAIKVLKEIQHLHRERNYSVKQIEHYFFTGGESYKPISEKSFDEKFADEINELKNQIKSLQEHNNKQDEFNKSLISKLEEQSKYIDDRLNKRDQLLMESIRQLQEAKALAAPTKEEKKGFFARLFGK